MNPSSWKTLALKLFCWGFGFGTGAALMAAGIAYHSSLPKSWDHSTFETKHSEMNASGYIGEDHKLEKMSVRLAADVENTGAEDLTLSKLYKVLQAAAPSGALHPSVLGIGEETLLPAHHTVRVELNGTYFCFDTNDPKQCLAESFAADSQVILLDQMGRREIRIGLPALPQVKQLPYIDLSGGLVPKTNPVIIDPESGERLNYQHVDPYAEIAK